MLWIELESNGIKITVWVYLQQLSDIVANVPKNDTSWDMMSEEMQIAPS